MPKSDLVSSPTSSSLWKCKVLPKRKVDMQYLAGHQSFSNLYRATLQILVGIHAIKMATCLNHQIRPGSTKFKDKLDIILIYPDMIYFMIHGYSPELVDSIPILQR